MQNTVYFDPGHYALDWLAEAVTRAQAEGRSLRINIEQSIEPGTGELGYALKYKVGEGMWSPPMRSMHDPNA
jgi:hypothetical protein